MKKTLMLTVLAFGAPALMTACGSESTNRDPAANVREANKDPGLQNNIYRGECSLRPLDALATGIATAGQAAIKSAREQFQFVGANVTHSTLLYTTADCSGDEALIFKEEGEFAIIEDSKTADGATFIDLSYQKLNVTSKSDAGALVAKDLKLCGTADWSKDTAREVTGQAKDANCYRREVPFKDLNVYLRDGNNLMFGKRTILTRSTERPTQLDSATKFVAD